MVKWSAATAFVAVVLAGCAEAGADAGEEPLPPAFNDLVVTSTTGAIRGIVVSEAIVPIADATVALEGTALVRQTGEDGAFVFDGIEPGTYFLSVSKPGYFTVQASSDVVAGVAEPPIVKVQMVIDAATQPFTELLTWDGFLQCGIMWSSGTLRDAPYPVYILGYVGVNACGPLDSRFIEEFGFGGGRVPELAQAEMVWDGTQPLSNILTLGFYPGSGTADWKGVDGPSPLMVKANQTEILEGMLSDEELEDGEQPESVFMRVFPGRSEDPASVVVTTNQVFTVYLHYFYGFEPREDWTFVAEGTCSSPEQCS